MRLLMTTDTVGGVWTMVRELTGGLLGQGHAVALVSFGRTPSPAQAAEVAALAQCHGERFSFTASDAPLEWMHSNEETFAAGAELLLRTAEAFHPDLLHSHQFCWGALPLACPRFITAHSDVLSWAAACRPAGLDPSPWLTRYRCLVQEGLDNATAVIAPTDSALASLQQHFQTPSPTHVIHNGIAAMTPRPNTARKLQAVTVGRLWDEAKGLHTLRDLASPMPVLVAGEDSFEGASTSHNLTALGPLAQPALFELFRRSAVYLAPSLYEPFGLAPLEAAANGCALFLRDLPTFRELWSGAAHFFRTPAELEVLLTRASQDPTWLAASQTRAHTRAQDYTTTRMTAQYLTLLTRVLAQQAAPEELAAHAA